MIIWNSLLAILYNILNCYIKIWMMGFDLFMLKWVRIGGIIVFRIGKFNFLFNCIIYLFINRCIDFIKTIECLYLGFLFSGFCDEFLLILSLFILLTVHQFNSIYISVNFDNYKIFIKGEIFYLSNSSLLSCIYFISSERKKIGR